MLLRENEIIINKILHTLCNLQSLSHLVFDLQDLRCPMDCCRETEMFCKLLRNMTRFKPSLRIGIRGQFEVGGNKAVAEALGYHPHVFYDAAPDDVIESVLPRDLIGPPMSLTRSRFRLSREVSSREWCRMEKWRLHRFCRRITYDHGRRV